LGGVSAYDKFAGIFLKGLIKLIEEMFVINDIKI